MTIVIVFLLVLFLLMYTGWRARKRRQASIAAPESVPAQLGEVLGTFDLLYVSTTVVDEPLNRIAVRGLGFRATAVVTVAETGVVLSLDGGADVFIPRDALRSVGTANLTIDRVVESGGLVRVGWNLGHTPVDSYLRLAESQPLITALNSLLPVTNGRKA
ncbi:hypothetical protein [Glaciihabitans sp. dw_435]|uniref:PH-like domain-containing protein n=1 Tax=Glaciihabitans sp. dw_435 TaxID=2720081 RepID=UPI002103C2CC|nr:hypothetical protein [Glaciihabitans sp. dw_435]